MKVPVIGKPVPMGKQTWFVNKPAASQNQGHEGLTPVSAPGSAECLDQTGSTWVIYWLLSSFQISGQMEIWHKEDQKEEQVKEKKLPF